MCTQGLMDYVAKKADSLSDKLADLERASMARGSARDGEMRYMQAFTEVMDTVLVLAMFTAELTTNRAVGWKDTDQISPVGVSLN